MKSRTKSTKTSLIAEGRKRISEQNNSKAKKLSKDETETRKYIVKSIALMQNRTLGTYSSFDKKSNTVNLAAHLYEVLKQQVGKTKRVNDASRSVILKSPNCSTQIEIPPPNVNRSTASLLEVVSVNSKRRSNSALDDYFRQTVCGASQNQEDLQKKIKGLKALKKFQDRAKSNILSSNNSKTGFQNSKIRQQMSELNENNILIYEKIRNKKPK